MYIRTTCFRTMISYRESQVQGMRRRSSLSCLSAFFDIRAIFGLAIPKSLFCCSNANCYSAENTDDKNTLGTKSANLGNELKDKNNDNPDATLVSNDKKTGGARSNQPARQHVLHTPHLREIFDQDIKEHNRLSYDPIRSIDRVYKVQHGCNQIYELHQVHVSIHTIIIFSL